MSPPLLPLLSFQRSRRLMLISLDIDCSIPVIVFFHNNLPRHPSSHFLPLRPRPPTLLLSLLPPEHARPPLLRLSPAPFPVFLFSLLTCWHTARRAQVRRLHPIVRAGWCPACRRTCQGDQTEKEGEAREEEGGVREGEGGRCCYDRRADRCRTDLMNRLSWA